MNGFRDIKVFIDILYQFLSHLESEFPSFQADIFLTRKTINAIEKGNPRLVVEQFMKHIKPYSKQINECEEEFFLNFDNLVNQSTPDSNIMFAMRIKRIWTSSTTTDTDKAKIWLYFKKLLKAGNRVIG